MVDAETGLPVHGPMFMVNGEEILLPCSQAADADGDSCTLWHLEPVGEVDIFVAAPGYELGQKAFAPRWVGGPCCFYGVGILDTIRLVRTNDQ